MSGNVLEWCRDWFGNYGSDPQNNPTGSASGSRRVVRGGCFGGSANLCRVSYRGSIEPTYLDCIIGLRLAL